jgi:quercetin dioxygenase-like cupin family protein
MSPRLLPIGLSLTVAFALGVGCARYLPAAHAADGESLTAGITDLLQITDADLGAPHANGIRARMLAVTPDGTVSVQTGDAPRHYHRDADEIQYIIEGTGTFWVGDTRHDVHPGDLIVIPKGTTHGGSVASSGRFKALSIHLPPQAPGDTYPSR